jgi:hypothetical protein
VNGPRPPTRPSHHSTPTLIRSCSTCYNSGAVYPRNFLEVHVPERSVFAKESESPRVVNGHFLNPVSVGVDSKWHPVTQGFGEADAPHAAVDSQDGEPAQFLTVDREFLLSICVAINDQRNVAGIRAGEVSRPQTAVSTEEGVYTVEVNPGFLSTVTIGISSNRSLVQARTGEDLRPVGAVVPAESELAVAVNREFLQAITVGIDCKRLVLAVGASEGHIEMGAIGPAESERSLGIYGQVLTAIAVLVDGQTNRS